MPRDVANRWNSTFDMLRFAFAYSEPINLIIGDRSMKIRHYEIKDDEWKLVQQLRDCLKVLYIYIYHCYFDADLFFHILIDI
jgi:hypothetical protein